MSDVTDTDRQTAMRVMAWEPLDYDAFANAVNNGHHPDDRDALETVDAIAAALAAERAKARAPFLALADDLERQAEDMELVRADAVAAKPADPATAYADAVARNVAKEWAKLAARIRRAPQDQT